MKRSTQNRRRVQALTVARRAVAGLAVWGLLAAQSQALTVPTLLSGDTKAAIAVCATERQPLVELQQEYAGVRRAPMTNAFASSAKAGLMLFLASNPLLSMASAAAKSRTALGGQQQTQNNPNDPNNQMLSEALSLRIPGVDPPPGAGDQAGGTVSQLARLVQPGQPVNDNTPRTLLAISMVAAIGGSTDVYIKIKQQQYRNDAQRISQSVDSDAGSQTPVGEQSATALKALVSCREKQVADFKEKLASATPKDKKQLLRSQQGLRAALTADFDLGNDLSNQQATVARVLTQGRAMADGASEVDVLGPQASAYGQASSQAWTLPPLETAAGVAAPPPQAPPPAPKVTLVTIRATALHATPDPKAPVVMHLAAGHTITPSRKASADTSWWEIDVAGTMAYVPDADLAPPGSPLLVAAATKAKGKGKGKGAVASAPPPPPPPPSGPPPASNIRSLNGAVILVRNSGADRLKALADSLDPAST
ncbi:hypothetical protein [Phenylobacterium sp.]|jgi:hypothetical protein|uniref:hypothetical protein n=1 Tax=Phenylobacterium sp. TaxID=1871053 RepID=UPI002F42EACC